MARKEIMICDKCDRTLPYGYAEIEFLEYQNGEAEPFIAQDWCSSCINNTKMIDLYAMQQVTGRSNEMLFIRIVWKEVSNGTDTATNTR